MSSPTCLQILIHESIEQEEEMFDPTLKLVMAKNGGKLPAARTRRQKAKSGMKNDDKRPESIKNDQGDNHI